MTKILFHKVRVQTVFAGALSLAITSAVSAQPARRFATPEVDSWMSEHVKAPAESLPLDEALSALARATSTNVFADVTDVAADTSIAPYAQRPKNFFETNYNGRRNIISHVARQAGLTQDRTTSDTLVFWREPDLNRVVNAIVERQNQLDAQYPTASQSESIAKIKAYYQRERGWLAEPQTIAEMQQSARGVKAINISQLPPEVRTPLQAELIRRVRSTAATPPALAFDISSWQNARVRLVNEKVNYFRPDGWVLGRADARVLRVFFPDERKPFLIGVPQWANPTFSMPDVVESSAYLDEGVPLAQFRIGQDKTAVAQAPFRKPIDFAADKIFDKSVKLVGKRQSLSALVAQISEQTKLKLSVAPEVASNAQVLAISSDIKAGEALAALERLYHAVWIAEAGGYVLQAQNLSDSQIILSQLGSQVYDGSGAINLPKRAVAGARIAEEVSVSVDGEQLQSAQGALFSQLAPATQSKVMQLFREDNAGKLAEQQQRVETTLDYINDFNVFFGNYPEKMSPFFTGQGSRWSKDVNFNGGIGLAAFAPGNRFIDQLFPPFRFARREKKTPRYSR